LKGNNTGKGNAKERYLEQDQGNAPDKQLIMIYTANRQKDAGTSEEQKTGRVKKKSLFGAFGEDSVTRGDGRVRVQGQAHCMINRDS